MLSLYSLPRLESETSLKSVSSPRRGILAGRDYKAVYAHEVRSYR